MKIKLQLFNEFLKFNFAIIEFRKYEIKLIIKNLVCCLWLKIKLSIGNGISKGKLMDSSKKKISVRTKFVSIY